ncbi:MAG: YbaB/EbfC family nucleoid-associated protein [Candidatus Aminicenantales bacterium]
MKDIANLHKMLRTAKEMQEKLQKEQAEMRIEGTSGGGMVSITLDGHKNVLAVRIEPEVVRRDDVEMLQDLVLAAFNDATAKVDETIAQKLGSWGRGFKIPGLF